MSGPATERNVRIVVSGRVQGVSFRYFTRRAAERLGLIGWVKNLPSGEVEVRVGGPESSLELFRGQLRQGPPASRVDDLAESELEVPVEGPGFRIVF